MRSIALAAVPVLAVVGAIALILALEPEEQPRPTTGDSTTPPPKQQYVDVTLDSSGKPYDRPLYPGSKIVRRRLAVLRAPSRRVLFLGGETVPYVKLADYEPVTLVERPGRRYPVDAIWIDQKKSFDSIVGVVIVERDTPVVRWRELHPVAYGTDGGVGGITTVEWAAQPKTLENELSHAYQRELIDNGRQSFTEDVDGHEGIDTIVFSNGFGDGGFPSVAGYDASGARVAIVLWTIVAPWRLAFPEGEPPPQVTRRENVLAACLAGKRKVELGSRCRRAG